MLRITGYSDKYSAFPSEKVKFYVNSEKNEDYDVQIIRLIHGDTNPEGPGYKEEEVGAKLWPASVTLGNRILILEYLYLHTAINGNFVV